MTDEQWRAHAAEEALRSAEALVRQALKLRPEIARGALSPHMTSLIASLWPAMQHHARTLIEADYECGNLIRTAINAEIAAGIAEGLHGSDDDHD